MTHTPEPMLVTGRTIYTLDETGEVNRISADVQCGYVSAPDRFTKGVRVSEAEAEATAQRLADCWNACAGIADPAHLIAAAPELYEALAALTLFHESGGHEGDADTALAMSLAALAKACGETA